MITDLIENFRTISIIGMGKNTGKTTTLNYILSETRDLYTFGLTSIGRDGEEYDSITFTGKPQIYVERGTYIATAKQTFFNSEITKEIIATTGINTSMGEIIIAKALNGGYVDLAGPSINIQMKEVCSQLLNMGCQKILIDGALNRKTQASPSVSEGTILTTGAALSMNIDETVEKTVFTVRLLSTKTEKDKEILSIIKSIMDKSRIGFIYRDKTFKTLEVLTSLESSKEIVENIDDATHVVIKGVISDKLIEGIMSSTKKHKNVSFIVEDGTKLFLSSSTYDKFKKMGGIFKVVEPITIICVTSNPVSPYGYEYDNNELLDKLRTGINLPVFDIMDGNAY